MDDRTDARTIGQRIRYHREKAGMSRPVLGGLVEKSAEWAKAVESGRLLPPRLPLLIRLSEVLGADLADLTGEQGISAVSWTRSGHESLPRIAAALTDYSVATAGRPLSAEELEAQVRQAWALWHGARRHRTAVAVVLPDLIGSARTAARKLDGAQRHRACAALAQVYHLAQLYLSFQPVPALILLTGDRAMTAALGSGVRPSARRTAWCRRSCSSLTSPVSRQRAKKAYTRGQGGKSEGIARHLMPLSTR